MNNAPELETGLSPEPIKHALLTADQRKKWEDTMSMMVWTAPGFQHILYKLLNAQNNANGDHVALMSQEAGIAMTDGKNVILNPDSFFLMQLPERVFVLGHEIIHNVYGDVEMLHRCVNSGKVPMNDGTSVPFNNDTMQRAMDARINALLIESRIGKAPKVGPALKGWLDGMGAQTKAGGAFQTGSPFGHFDDTVKGHESVLDIYKKYYEEDFPDGDGEGQGKGNNPGGFDTLAKPGKSTGQNPQQAAQDRNPGQWAVEIAAAQTIEQARSQGKMAAALQRMFKQILEPEVPWVDHIETLINRACGGGGYDWNIPNPWLGNTDNDDEQYFAPSDTGHGAGWIVMWGDTSGSRSDAEIASNMAELAGIMEAVNPQRMTILWCDAEIDYVDEIIDPSDLANIQARGTAGGGGTSMQPVLDWIAEQPDTPELFIGFTDGYVSFPDRELPYPTIWASSTDKAYPFGQVVRVNKIQRGQP